MEASAFSHSLPAPALVGRSPLLRLQSDERLIALIRRGHHAAFEALMQRYQPRLLAFCRHMLSSTEDAEDVLQEVFAAAFNAMLADERPINARPWLYRIARNRCLNHLRRPSPSGQDSMDVFERDGGATTADTVHRREEFRQIVADVQDLPETQRTALLLREIDALSYEQIAEAMETTVPSVKSLLVRARVSLAEAAEARKLTCEEVRLELGQVAEGLARSSAPARRHVRACERCSGFRKELRATNRALAAVYPLGPLVLLKKVFIAKLGAAAGGTTAAGGSAAGGAGIAGGAAVAAGGATAGGAISAGLGTVASKTAAGLAAAAIVTAGAVEVNHVGRDVERAPAAVAAATSAPDPVVAAAPTRSVTPDPVAPAPARTTEEPVAEEPPAKEEPPVELVTEPAPTPPAEPVAKQPPAATTAPAPAPPPKSVDEQRGTVVLPPDTSAPQPAEGDPVAPAEEPPPAMKPAGSGREQQDTQPSGGTEQPSGQADPAGPAPSEQ